MMMEFLKPVANVVSQLMGPKYDGSYLHDKIKSLTRDVRIADTVTNATSWCRRSTSRSCSR
jgi:hypothetical protein